MPQPRRRGDGRLSGYSDSRNRPSGLQPVATEPDTARAAEGEGRGRARGRGRGEEVGGKKTTSDKSVKARVKAAAENRMEEKGDRKRGVGGRKKKPNNTLIGLSRSN